MSSSLAEAINHSLVASFDPMTAVTKQLALQMVATGAISQDKEIILLVQQLEPLHEEAKAKDPESAATKAYARMLTKYSDKVGA